MTGGKEILTFPCPAEFAKARTCLDRLALDYAIISPRPGFSRVGVDSLVMEPEVRVSLFREVGAGVICSGWVAYQPTRITTSAALPATFPEDIVGAVSIVVMAPCIADSAKIRLIVHIAGNLSGVFPYLNTEMPQAMYSRETETFTYMDAHRLVTLYPQRITLAKADDLVDAWHSLEKIRCRANDTWGRRHSLAPSWEMRQKPPALEIYKRLPRTNCGACGEKTCLAFALRLHNGEVSPLLCAPVFSEEHGQLRIPFLEICSSLGLSTLPPFQKGE